MYYAIQHMEIRLLYDKKTKKFLVKLNDTYDFTEWRSIFSANGVSFSNFANDLGFLMQKCAMMIPYDIALETQTL